MQEHYQKALDEVLEWIEKNYSTIGVIVSGSIIRGNPSKESDFDIYVIHEENFRQRVQKYFNKVPCEIFINSVEQTRLSFKNEQNDNRPVTAHMISTGKVVKGEENIHIKKIVEEANEIQNLPKKANQSDLVLYKYSITNLLEDANDIAEIDSFTSKYILNKVVDKIIDYWFVKNQIPLPRIKERLKVIETIDLEFFLALKSLFEEANIENYLEKANKLIEDEVGEKGFFEWQTERN